MRGSAKVPSVLGGYRPQVKDDAQAAFQRVQYLRGEVRKAREKLQNLETQLYAAEEERGDFQSECERCGNCSACIG